MKDRSWIGTLISIIIIEILGFVSGFLSGNTREIYNSLIKPPLSPPGWLFGVAWIILYGLMGWSIYLIYSSTAKEKRKREAISIFIMQLALNLIWPILFFRFNLLWIAVVIIFVLDGLVYLTISRFRKVDRGAAILLIPYFIWILFATYLNLGFAILNQL